MQLSETEWFLVKLALVKCIEENNTNSTSDMEKLLYQIRVNRMEIEGSIFHPDYDWDRV